MDCQNSRLLRHLSLVVVAKLAVLGAVWWAFIQPAQAPQDSDSTASHLLASGPATAVPATPPQDPPQ